MSKITDRSKEPSRGRDVLMRALGLDYDRYAPSRLSWDYEALMREVGLDIDRVAQIQREVFVGGTPLAELKNITELARLIAGPGKGARIFLKDEASNPTGSFKDRRASLPVYFAAERDYPGVVAATSGNYGAAVASQAARRGLKAIIIQEVYDSQMRGQPESLEKGRACESYGAEVQQLTVGPEVFNTVILQILEETGYFSASLYLPHSIAGIETLGSEIATGIRGLCGRDPDVVLVTHAGGGNITGTARGLARVGCTAERVAVSVDLGELNLHDDALFSRKTFSTGHTGYGYPSLYNPESVDVPLNAARPLRYIDRYVTVSQGEVFFATEMLAQLEGLSRGPAGNTSLAAAFCIAQELDRDQIVVVQETEGTGAGKLHTAQITFARENGVRIARGDPRQEVAGESIVIPDHPRQMSVHEVDLDVFRRRYLQAQVTGKGMDGVDGVEVDYLAQEMGLDREATLRMLQDAGIAVSGRVDGG